MTFNNAPKSHLMHVCKVGTCILHSRARCVIVLVTFSFMHFFTVISCSLSCLLCCLINTNMVDLQALSALLAAWLDSVLTRSPQLPQKWKAKNIRIEQKTDRQTDQLLEKRLKLNSKSITNQTLVLLTVLEVESCLTYSTVLILTSVFTSFFSTAVKIISTVVYTRLLD